MLPIDCGQQINIYSVNWGQDFILWNSGWVKYRYPISFIHLGKTPRKFRTNCAFHNPNWHLQWNTQKVGRTNPKISISWNFMTSKNMKNKLGTQMHTKTLRNTLHETNSSHLKMDGDGIGPFPFRMAYFQGRTVSFRERMFCKTIQLYR